MKSILLSSVSIAALTGFALPALAGSPFPVALDPVVMEPVAVVADEPSGLWYVSLFAGGSVEQPVVTNFYSASEYTVDFDTGFVGGLTVGRRLTDNIRVEAELSYSSHAANAFDYIYVSSVTITDSGTADGDLSAIYLLANVWYDIPMHGGITPYIGGGIGMANVNGDITFDGATYGYGPGETKFAAQLGVGASIQINPSMAIDVGYRYKFVNDVDFQDSDGLGVYTGGNLASHNLQVGLTFAFGN